MKYLRYLSIVFTKLFVFKAGIYLALVFMGMFAFGFTVLPVIGVIFYLWFILGYVTRKWSRNIVQNYVLENGVHLPRLFDRKPKLINGRYWLEDIHRVQERNALEIDGYIEYKKVSYAKYLLALVLWVWVDDDSNHDTYDGKYIEGKVYGNAFDLGDVRGQYSQWDWKKSVTWLIRNTGYNFNYMFEECAEDSKWFFYHRFTTKWFDWHFGFIPYSNSSRQGRMVWFTEDIDKLD